MCPRWLPYTGQNPNVVSAVANLTPAYALAGILDAPCILEVARPVPLFDKPRQTLQGRFGVKRNGVNAE